MTTMIVDELGRIPMSPFLKATLTRAAEYAAAQTHREVTLEHLLLSLADDPEASIILKSSNVDISRLMSDVSGYLGRHEDRVDPASGPPASAISSELRKILEAAATAAQQSRRREINGAIVLAAIVGDGKSPAAHMLRAQGLTFEQAIRALQKAASAPRGSTEAQAASSGGDRAEASRPKSAVAAKDEGAAAQEALGEKTSAQEPKTGSPVERRPSAPADRDSDATSATTDQPPSAKSKPDTSLDEAVASIRRGKPGAVGAGISGPPVKSDFDPGAPDWQLVRPPPAEGRRPADAQQARTPAPPHGQPDQSAPVPPQQTWAPPPISPSQPAPAPRRVPPPMAPPTNRGPLPVGSSPPPAGFPQPQTSAGGQSPAAAPGSQPPWTGAPHMRPPQADALDRLDARRPRSSAAGRAGQGGRASVEAGQLQENLPRKMRVGVPVVAEALIARADVKNLAERIQSGGAAYRHEISITRAMTVRLRAPDGGFTIETASPETQWIENILNLPESDSARWRWVITAKERGKKRLQLVVSARTVDHEGLAAETALPDKVIDVRVSINYARTAKMWAGWITAAVLGGVLARFGDQAYDMVRMIIARVSGG